MDPNELVSVKELKQELQSKRVSLKGLNEKRELIQALGDEVQTDVFTLAKDDALTRFIKSHGFSAIPCEGSRSELIQRARDVWSVASGESTGPSSENLKDVDSILMLPARALHEALGLKPSRIKVPAKDLQDAYRTTIRKVHPDKNRAQGAKQAAARVNDAYEKLKNGAIAERVHAASTAPSPPSGPSYARRTDFSGHPFFGGNYGRYGRHSYNGFYEDQDDEYDEEEAFLDRERREQAKREAQRAKKDEESRKKKAEQEEQERRKRAQEEEERRKREQERLAQKQKRKAEAEARVLQAHREQMETEALRRLHERQREEEWNKVFTSQPQEAPNPPFIFGRRAAEPAFVHPVRYSSPPFAGGAAPDDSPSSSPRSASKPGRSATKPAASLKKESSPLKREYGQPKKPPAEETPFRFSFQTSDIQAGKGGQGKGIRHKNGFRSNQNVPFVFGSTEEKAEAWTGFQFGEKASFVFGAPSPSAFGASPSTGANSPFVFGMRSTNQHTPGAHSPSMDPGGTSVEGGKDASMPTFVFGAWNQTTPVSSKPGFDFGSSSTSARPSPFVFGSSSWTNKDNPGLFKFGGDPSKLQQPDESPSFVFGSTIEKDKPVEAMNWDDLPPLPPSSSSDSSEASQSDEDEENSHPDAASKTKKSPRKTIHSKLKARKGRVSRLRGVHASFKAMNLSPEAAEMDEDL